MRAGWNGAVPPVLAPPDRAGRLRRVGRAVGAILWTAWMFLAFLGLRWLDRLLGRDWAPGVVRRWAGGALGLLGLRVEVTGLPMAHPGAIVANHAGWVDIVVLMRSSRVFFVSKSEVARWPGIGFLARHVGTMFIDRRPVEARRQTEALHRRLSRGDRLCLFPEGTSSDGLRVLAFKSALFGVFLAPDLKDQLWVQPVSLRYRPAPGYPDTLYGWWGEMDFGAHLWAVLAVPRGGVVRVVFHPPLAAAEFEDRKALAEAAERLVRGGHAMAA